MSTIRKFKYPLQEKVEGGGGDAGSSCPPFGRGVIKSGFIGFNTYTKKTYLYGNLILRYEGEQTALRILVTDAHRFLSFLH